MIQQFYSKIRALQVVTMSNPIQTYFRSFWASTSSLANFSFSSASHSASVSYLNRKDENWRRKLVLSKRTKTHRLFHFPPSMPEDVVVRCSSNEKSEKIAYLKTDLQRSCYFSFEIQNFWALWVMKSFITNEAFLKRNWLLYKTARKKCHKIHTNTNMRFLMSNFEERQETLSASTSPVCHWRISRSASVICLFQSINFISLVESLFSDVFLECTRSTSLRTALLILDSLTLLDSVIIVLCASVFFIIVAWIERYK